jgi:hypothetical protein
MENSSRPLWQLLLLTSDNKNSVHLNCAECFTLLDYDIDLLAAGADIEKLRPLVQRHLSCCPECQKTLNRWLEEIKG